MREGRRAEWGQKGKHMSRFSAGRQARETGPHVAPRLCLLLAIPRCSPKLELDAEHTRSQRGRRRSSVHYCLPVCVSARSMYFENLALAVDLPRGVGVREGVRAKYADCAFAERGLRPFLRGKDGAEADARPEWEEASIESYSADK